MEKLGEQKFEINDNRYVLNIYSHFMEVIVHISHEIFINILKKIGTGQFESERIEIGIYIENIFSSSIDNIKFFSSKEDYHEFMQGFGISSQLHDNNGWFKKFVFILNEKSFEEELASAIDYVKEMAIKSDFKKDNNRKSIVSKLLRNKF